MRAFLLHVLMTVVLFFAARGALTATTPGPDLDKLIGQPADVAPSAYQYRCDRPAADNPPESVFLFTALKHNKAGALCGLLWEEPRPVRRVVLAWPAAAKAVPKPEQVVLRWFPEGGSASWWCRAGEGSKLHETDKPIVSADGRVFSYTLDALANDKALDNLIVAVKDGAGPAGSFDVPTIEVLAPQTWKPLELVIEWGFQEGTVKLPYDGSVEIYNGLLGTVAPLAGDQGTRMTGVAGWESRAIGTSRRGLTAHILYVGYTDTPVWPGQAKIEDVNRTIVTVRTRSGSFSFLPADLETGPILAPEYGFFVAKAGSGDSARWFQKDLAAKGLRTIRQRTRQREEQSWDGAMRALHGDRPLPPYPQPALESPMKIDVPEPRLNDAWRVGAWHLLRHCKKDKNGRYDIEDFPYPTCGLETEVIIHALDLMGMHAAAQDGLARWATQLGMPTGQFSDGDGCFMDPWHLSETPWSTQWALVEHYLLTGDKEWFSPWIPRIAKNADWIARQRRGYLKNVSGRDRLWMRGLLPPSNIWDSMVVRPWYSIDANSCFALGQFAEAIARIDPQAGQAYRAEAAAYAKDILAAAEKSLVLSPVIRVRDGTYRSFLPPAPYMRGPASRYMPTSFGDPAHTPGLYADAIRGGVHFINRSRLLGPEDPRAQGIIDVLEDRLLSEHDRLAIRTKGYGPEKHWFSHAGWYYQCGIERTADVHLQWDDVPNFLRSFYNDYAVDIVVGPYTFDEHTTRGPTDKSFEEAVFLERLRLMLVMEEGDTLWLARATPRAWLEQGKKIAVHGAPTDFGTLAYQIVSDADHGKITATIQMPSRNPPQAVLLRLRHPQAATIKSVAVNGRPWTDFEPAKELIRLHGLQGAIEVEATY